MAAYYRNQRAADLAIFSAAALVPAVVWALAPLFSIMAVLFIPIPLAMIVRRLDLRYCLAVILIMASVAAAISSSPLAGLLLAMQTGPLGLFLGLLFKNHVPSGKALFSTAVLALAVSAVMFASGYLLMGNNPLVLNDSQRYVFDQERQMLHEVFRQGGAAGVDPSTMKDLEMVIDRLEALWPVMAISSAMIWIMVSALISFWLTRKVMVRYGHMVPAALPFVRWRLPWYVIWGVIAGLALLLAGDQFGAGGLAAAGKAALWVMGFIMAMIGASVLGYYIQRWRMAWPFKVLAFLIMGIYLPVTSAALVATGLLDAIWNIRRLGPDGRPPGEEDKRCQ